MKETCATIRIYSSSKTANDISTLLSIVPSEYTNKGDLRQGRFKSEKTIFLYDSSLSKESNLENHINHLLNILEEKKNKLLEMSSDGDEIDIFCFFSTENGQGGFCLNTKMLQRLATLPVDISFDLYLSDDAPGV
ncbi:MAG: DUF4279 domain-containing protein [Legionellales bacterium]|nr:DUF4279 domain-containing protein [Legionellales bacterium]